MSKLTRIVMAIINYLRLPGRRVRSRDDEVTRPFERRARLLRKTQRLPSLEQLTAAASEHYLPAYLMTTPGRLPIPTPPPHPAAGNALAGPITACEPTAICEPELHDGNELHTGETRPYRLPADPSLLTDRSR
jgi:hypothetical protein